MSQESGRSGPSTTGYALLGLLSFERELSGYELKKFADDSLRFFWAAPAMSQVYGELERLGALGLVASREVPGDGTRTTRVWRLTTKGKAALRRWLRDQPVQEPVLKHGVALRLFLGHLTEPDRLLEIVREHAQRCEKLLAELHVVRAGLDEPDWRYAAMVADWGLAYYESEIEAARRLEVQLLDREALG